MATILEAGPGTETWVSEHSGKTFTGAPSGGVDDQGRPVISDAGKAAWDHENTDHAEERESLQVGVEHPVVNAATPAGPQSISGDDYADFMAFKEYRRTHDADQAAEAAKAEQDRQKKYQEWLDSSDERRPAPAGDPVPVDQGQTPQSGQEAAHQDG